MPRMATIAWLGTGLLGSGFVKAALRRGDTVRVWNRTASKAQALKAEGAVPCASVAEAAQGAERVHLCLSDDAAVEGVLEQLLAVPGFKGPVIDHTTVTPMGAEARAKRLAAKGVAFLACPVFMGPANAEAAQGRMLCAGDAALVERLAPALRQMTGELVLTGGDVKTPCTYKLIGNSMIIGLTGVVADALALAPAAGLAADDVVKFLGAFPLAGLVAGRGARMAKGDYAPASFELTMARKDVRLMQETAAGRPLATLDGLGARMDSLIAKGHGEKDLAVLSVETIPAAKP